MYAINAFYQKLLRNFRILQRKKYFLPERRSTRDPDKMSCTVEGPSILE